MMHGQKNIKLPWCKLQSVQAPRSTSKPSRSYPEPQVQAQVLHGHHASIFEPIICEILMIAVQQTEDIFLHHSYEFVCLA